MALETSLFDRYPLLVCHTDRPAVSDQPTNNHCAQNSFSNFRVYTRLIQEKSCVSSQNKKTLCKGSRINTSKQARSEGSTARTAVTLCGVAQHVALQRSRTGAVLT